VALTCNLNCTPSLGSRHWDHGSVKDCKKDLKVKAKGPLTNFLAIVKDTLADLKREPSTEHVRYQLLHIRDILERWKVRPWRNGIDCHESISPTPSWTFLRQIVGLNRKIQIKPKEFDEFVDDSGETQCRCTEVQLVLKWGGNLTKLGK
jgi:inositol-hexakisphosphate/diphosphoinositol-pentakisphosphate 1-kinase